MLSGDSTIRGFGVLGFWGFGVLGFCVVYERREFSF